MWFGEFVFTQLFLEECFFKLAIVTTIECYEVNDMIISINEEPFRHATNKK